MSAENPPLPSYEEALAQLEGLLAKMEDGDVPLADLVAHFSEGNRLLKLCEQRLREAELKVEQLKSVDQGHNFEPFAPSEGAS